MNAAIGHHFCESNAMTPLPPFELIITLDVSNARGNELQQLDISAKIDDLRAPPGNRLEPLKGNRSGWFSIRVNDQWRLCFRWEDGDAVDVEIVDYH